MGAAARVSGSTSIQPAAVEDDTAPILRRSRQDFPLEVKLNEKGLLALRHRNKKWLFYSGVVGWMEGPSATDPGSFLTADQAEYWYRTMPKWEFDYLNANGVLYLEDSSYVGIAPNRSYVLKYMGNNKEDTHVVEFHVVPPLKLYEEFTAYSGESGQ